MIRTIERNMARSRMKDMGFDKINKQMHTPYGPKTYPSPKAFRRLQKTWKGRKLLASIREENMPLWKRILWGEYRESSVKAEKKASYNRMVRRHPEKAKKPERIIQQVFQADA